MDDAPCVVLPCCVGGRSCAYRLRPFQVFQGNLVTCALSLNFHIIVGEADGYFGLSLDFRGAGAGEVFHGYGQKGYS